MEIKPSIFSYALCCYLPTDGLLGNIAGIKRKLIQTVENENYGKRLGFFRLNDFQTYQSYFSVCFKDQDTRDQITPVWTKILFNSDQPEFKIVPGVFYGSIKCEPDHINIEEKKKLVQDYTDVHPDFQGESVNGGLNLVFNSFGRDVNDVSRDFVADWNRQQHQILTIDRSTRLTPPFYTRESAMEDYLRNQAEQVVKTPARRI